MVEFDSQVEIPLPETLLISTALVDGSEAKNEELTNDRTNN